MKSTITLIPLLLLICSCGDHSEQEKNSWVKHVSSAGEISTDQLGSLSEKEREEIEKTKGMIPEAYAKNINVPYGGTVDCPAKAMLNFYKKNGKLIAGKRKDSQIGILSNEKCEMRAVFTSCVPETISIKSKTTKAQSFYKYSNGVLITYDTLGANGEDVLHYDSQVYNSSKPPAYVVLKFR